MNKIFPRFFILVLVTFVGFNADAGTKVGLLYNDKVPIYKQIADKFKNEIEAEGNTTKELAYSSEEDAMPATIKSSGCSYFFTVGAPAAKACFSAGYPGVFTMVVDPVKSGLIDKNGVPLGQMTGVLVDISPRIQFSTLKNMLGSRTRGGIIYDPQVSSFVVAEHIKVSSEFGFQVYEVPVSNKDEVPPAVEGLKKKADFILSVVDNTVYNVQSIQIILRFSITNKIPLIGFSSQQVKAGALIGFYCDYPKLGVQSAKLLSNLIHGADISTCIVELPADTKYSINMQTANIMKIAIPGSVKSGAEEVFGE